MGRIRDVRITGQGILPVAVLCDELHAKFFC